MSDAELSPEDAARGALESLHALEQFTAAAIVAELRPLVPVYSSHVKETATVAKAAEQALERPSGALEVLRAELADAERLTSHVASGLDTGTFEERAEARYKIEAYERECGRIQERICAAEQDLIVLIEKRNETHAAAEAAFGGMIALGDALARPFEAPIAQATDAYRTFRAPMLWMVRLTGDKTHPEWAESVRQWLEEAKVSGLRTEHYRDDLPSDAEHFRKFWNEYEADPEAVPSGQEIISGIHAGGVSSWLNQRNKKDRGGKIEDHRIPAPPRLEFDYQPLRNVRT